MGVAWRASRARATWALLAVSALWGCAAAPLVAIDGGFRHAQHGYRIGLPPSASAPWERVEVEGSDLAYRRPGPIWMTLSSRCHVPISRPQILARHLRLGIPEHTVRQSGAVEANGLSGWQQVFDATPDDTLVRIKTVTFVANDCAFDAVLSARDEAGFEEAEPAFDAWWSTLRLDETSSAAAESAP
jgi:hypothetical protein